MNKPSTPLPKQELTTQQIRRRTFLSFAGFALANVVGWSIFRTIKTAPPDGGTQAPLRSVLETNEKLFSSAFDPDKLVKEYPASAAVKNLRVNGTEGMEEGVSDAGWRLQVQKSGGGALAVSLADIQKLPKKEIVFDFKCIEGWSAVTHWGGVPFKTFMQAYGLNAEKGLRYIGLQTVNKEYYVGIDMPSVLHEQTILAYEMNGAPLSPEHGAPLRLIIPVKYGIKHLKQVGTLFFSNTKPPDYWADQGYDYYAGH
jgi:DMSO/TMAO reductase YedYZ molybdopterin-dependent catalytic subunit